MFNKIVFLAFIATVSAQTGENFCQTGTVNVTGSNSICSSGAFTLCSPFPGVAQQQANMIASNMTSITADGQVSKGNTACGYLTAAGSSAWTDPAQVCPPIPANGCTMGASCNPPSVPLTPAANATLPCCSDLRYFARFWCTGANMLDVNTQIYPGSNKITLLSYLPGLGQVKDCRLCGAELPSTTTTVTTTTTSAATTTSTTTSAAVVATTGTVAAAGSTVAGSTSAAVVATTQAAVATTQAAAVTTTKAGTVSAAAIATTANVVATTAANVVVQPTQAPSPNSPAATPGSLIGETSTPSSAVRASASMLAVIALPLIIASLF